jgi:hypothetical protein
MMTPKVTQIRRPLAAVTPDSFNSGLRATPRQA